MKNLFVLLVFSVFACFSVSVQYTLDFNDSQTYSATCGAVNSTQWTVSNKCCSLLIPDLIVADPANTSIPVYMTINQSGNLEPEDSIVFMYQINSDPWVLDTVVYGDGGTSVRVINETISTRYNDTLRLVIVAECDKDNEFWSIKSGEIELDYVVLESALPVEMMYFNADYNRVDNAVSLLWATASENNSSHFVVSRSVDAKSFEEIAWVGAAGNSSIINEYEYTDVFVPNFSTVYYKLTQYDFDGSSYDKDIIAVLIENGMQMVEVQSSENYFIANVNVPVNESAVLSIIDITGKLIYETEIFSGNPITRIDAELLKNQIYILSVRTSLGLESVKFYAR